MAVINRNYHIGDRPTVSAAFLNLAGASEAPTAVTVKVKDPAGTTTTYTSPDATITLAATCTFLFPAAFTVAGRYHVQFIGTAGVQAGDEEYLNVLPTAFD